MKLLLSIFMLLVIIYIGVFNRENRCGFTTRRQRFRQAFRPYRRAIGNFFKKK